jgi:hypothetical protein
LNNASLDPILVHTLTALPLSTTTKSPMALLHGDVSTEDANAMAKLSQTLSRAHRQRIKPQGKLLASLNDIM